MEANNSHDRSQGADTYDNEQPTSDNDNEILIEALKSATSSAAQGSSAHPELRWLQPYSVAPLSVADTDARFNQEHPPQPRGVKRRGGGRPRKPDSELKRPRVDPRAKPTKLRPNSTIHLHVPSDIWHQIFLFTDYKTVRNLKQTCHDTYEATDSVSFWKAYIQRHAYLPGMKTDLPDLPPGLTLSKYAHLLFGKGCMLCTSAKSIKVQWAFYRRWCKNCFSEMTYSDAEAKSITNKYGDLLGCIPTGVIDIWKNYYSVSTLTANEISANYRSEKKYISVTKKDLTAIVKECEAFLDSLPSDLNASEREERLAAWRTERTSANRQVLRHAKKCEDFATERESMLKDYSKDQSSRLRRERELFFTEKAARLNPPVSHRILEKIPGYCRSVNVKRPPTERSWREILVKINQYRDAAEMEWQQEIHSNPMQLFGRPPSSSRNSLTPPDLSVLRLLEQFAEKAMAELESENTAAEDFTYLTLQRTREMYYNCPLEHRPRFHEQEFLKAEDGSHAYILTMRDAYHLQQRIADRLTEWQKEKKIRTIPKFYCPACTRRDYRRAWSFRKLFTHLCSTHAKPDLSSPFRSYAETQHARQVVGLFVDLFHWKAIPWPHNLPILAAHHKPTGRWDPNSTEYERAPPIRNDPFTSPFEGRSVRKCETDGSNSVDIITSAVVEASSQLKSINLTASLKGLIAWTYATKNLALYPDCKILPNDLDNLSISLIRNGEYSVFSRVGCKFCEKQCDLQNDRGVSARSNLKYTETRHSFDTIVRHCKQDHVGNGYNPSDLTREMLLFPSERKLAEALFETEDEGDALRAVFNDLFPSEDLSEIDLVTSDLISEDLSSNPEAETAIQTSRNRSKGKKNKLAQGPSSSGLDQTALNLLAEQAAKIDPRLADDGSEGSGEDEALEGIMNGTPPE